MLAVCLYISDMNSFIPEEDMPAFEKFLSDNNLRSRSSSVGAMPPPPPAMGIPAPPPPSVGAGRAPDQGTTEVDSFLMDLNREKDSILTTNF